MSDIKPVHIKHRYLKKNTGKLLNHKIIGTLLEYTAALMSVVSAITAIFATIFDASTKIKFHLLKELSLIIGIISIVCGICFALIQRFKKQQPSSQETEIENIHESILTILDSHNMLEKNCNKDKKTINQELKDAIVKNQLTKTEFRILRTIKIIEISVLCITLLHMLVILFSYLLKDMNLINGKALDIIAATFASLGAIISLSIIFANRLFIKDISNEKVITSKLNDILQPIKNNTSEKAQNSSHDNNSEDTQNSSHDNNSEDTQNSSHDNNSEDTQNSSHDNNSENTQSSSHDNNSEDTKDSNKFIIHESMKEELQYYEENKIILKSEECTPKESDYSQKTILVTPSKALQQQEASVSIKEPSYEKEKHLTENIHAPETALKDILNKSKQSIQETKDIKNDNNQSLVI